MPCAYVQPEYWKQQCACVCMCEHLCLRFLFSVFSYENGICWYRKAAWLDMHNGIYEYTRVLQETVQTTGVPLSLSCITDMDTKDRFPMLCSNSRNIYIQLQ